MTHRDRALLDQAHDAPCFVQLACDGNPSVPAHSDMLEDGRGEGHKSHDCLAVGCCPGCHRLFTREHLGRKGYFEVHARALKRYIVWLFTTGRIHVKRKGATLPVVPQPAPESRGQKLPRKSSGRVFENMTKVFITIGKDVLVVQVRSKAKERSFVGRAEVLALKNKVPFENIDRLADAIEAVPNVIRYEITGTDGMGGAVYMEWP